MSAHFVDGCLLPAKILSIGAMPHLGGVDILLSYDLKTLLQYILMSLSGLASALQDIIYDMWLNSKKISKTALSFAPSRMCQRPSGITVADVTESQLQSIPARINATRPLRVYATTARSGSANLVEFTSRHLSSAHLTGISGFPDDFAFASVTTHHKLASQTTRDLPRTSGGNRQADAARVLVF